MRPVPHQLEVLPSNALVGGWAGSYWLATTVAGATVPDLTAGLGSGGRAGPANAPDLVRLIRTRAASRGLAVSLERMRGDQILPLDVDGAPALWEYGIQISGRGSDVALRRFLADLDMGEWMLHVQELQVRFEKKSCRFALKGSLLFL